MPPDQVEPGVVPATVREAAVAAPGEGPGRDRVRVRHTGLDGFDAAVLAGLALLSAWVMIVLVAGSGADRIWTGTDGPFVGDQMQYLGWIEDASRHLLIANPFVVAPTAAVYLNPALALSGGLVRLGMSPSAAYLAWKPVAVLALFVATRSFVRHQVSGIARRRAALVLALFFISPAAVLAAHLHWFRGVDLLSVQAAATEMWPGLYLWGYPLTAIAVAAMAGTIVAYGRDRGTGRIRAWTPLFGLTCAWLQPWQGATLLAILVVTEGVLWWRGRKEEARFPVRLTSVTAAAIVLPLAYYSVLGRVDPSWSHAGMVNHIVFPWLPVGVALLPLALAGAFAYRLPAPEFRDVALRVWPLAAAAVYLAIATGRVGTYALHALQGLSIPLAVLAVVGAGSLHLPRSRWPAVAATVAVAVLVVPAGAAQLNGARSIGRAGTGSATPIFITVGERDAFAFLRQSPLPGAVLAPVDLGMAVPAETGRNTWVGIFSWTPDFTRRTFASAELFAGDLAPGPARALVRSSGVRFLLSGCSEHGHLASALAPVLATEHHFGCATVYEVRPG